MPEEGCGTKGIIMVELLQSLDTKIATGYSSLVNRTGKCSSEMYMQTSKYTGNGKSHVLAW